MTSNEDMTVECRADAEPKPSIKWLNSKGLINFCLTLFTVNKEILNQRERN